MKIKIRETPKKFSLSKYVTSNSNGIVHRFRKCKYRYCQNMKGIPSTAEELLIFGRHQPVLLRKKVDEIRFHEFSKNIATNNSYERETHWVNESYSRAKRRFISNFIFQHYPHST